MKKISILLVTFTMLLGCGDDVVFNTPSIEGNRNGELWRATYYAADIDFGGFIFEGGSGTEVLQLVTSNDIAGTYELGSASASVAIFRDAQGVVYSTANDPHETLSLYPAEGQIIVDFVDDSVDPKRITGTFWFHAYTSDGLKTVNFNEGNFYRVPLIGGLVAIGNQNTCLQATQALLFAEQEFNNTDTGSPEYPEVCNNYKVALQESIDACGDENGDLQTLLAGLGDCL
ncbi:DUF6252 family protein [Winogradskyella sp. 3972H.M.0a.05]|uniref:DUF6252 family protein n=1 Tax=Winogradskyella sp. 3972H.M.0a.05 TaxID=2950277 RepID=UPI0033984235